jgi:hypothetical protein
MLVNQVRLAKNLPLSKILPEEEFHQR